MTPTFSWGTSGPLQMLMETPGSKAPVFQCVRACLALCRHLFHCILRRWRASLLLHFIGSSWSSKDSRGEDDSSQKQERPGPTSVQGFYCSCLPCCSSEALGALPGLSRIHCASGPASWCLLFLSWESEGTSNVPCSIIFLHSIWGHTFGLPGLPLSTPVSL